MDSDINVRPEIAKLLEDNVEEKIHDIGHVDQLPNESGLALSYLQTKIISEQKQKSDGGGRTKCEDLEKANVKGFLEGGAMTCSELNSDMGKGLYI